jgi:hypothetical protein
LAEEGKNPEEDSKIPVFKLDGGFDRAKYDSQLRSMVTMGGQVTGNTVDEDLKEQKKSVEDIEAKAIKFYDEKYDEALKKIDPGIDRSSVFYRESESNSSRDKKSIKKGIEAGKTVDGKEIIEMASNSAATKIKNTETLKSGTVTQLAEKIGREEIESFKGYDSIVAEFDKKMNNEKFNFETIIDGLFSKLDSINNSEENAAPQYTTEDNALISALAKILELEGIKNESTTAMSERYESNTDKLAAKASNKGNAIESVKSETISKTEKEVSKTETTGEKLNEVVEKKETPSENTTVSPKNESTITAVEQVKSGENLDNTKASSTSMETTATSIAPVTETKTNETGAKEEVKAIEGSPIATPDQGKKEQTAEIKTEISNITNTNITTGSPAENTVQSLEGLAEASKLDTGESPTTLAVSSAPTITESGSTALSTTPSIEGSAGSNVTATPTSTEPSAEKKESKLGMFESLFGKKYADLAKGAGGVMESSGGKLESVIEKVGGGEIPGVSAGQLTSKLEEGISTISKSNETSNVSTPIKETITQNLSSVIPSLDKEAEQNKTETTPEKTQTINKTETQATENKTQEITQKTGDDQVKAIPETEEEKMERQKAEKEMQENIKRMVTILSQLNSTLQNPLIVIPNEKKFA